MRILIVTPVRDEGEYISACMDSMARQTVPPAKWIIVNDGSSDDTEGKIFERIPRLPFAEYLTLPDRGFRKPGAGVVGAFLKGVERAKGFDYDIISKFDADLEFGPHLLEEVVQAFRKELSLGIAGPVRYERKTEDRPLERVLMPEGFVGGPAKFYRKRCLEEIGGLIARAGWDGVDIVRANMRGWKTYEVPHLGVVHLKPTGSASGEGTRRAFEKYGDVSYYMGGHLWYFLLRATARALEKRDVRPAIFMLNGYVKAFLKGEPRENDEFRRFLREWQRRVTLSYINVWRRSLNL